MKAIDTEVCGSVLLGIGGETVPVRKHGSSWYSYWKPSDEEKAAIAAGLPVRLTVRSDTHPSVRLDVEAI